MKLSLARRLILGSALLLPVFLGASGWYLERSHRASLEAGEAERLPLQVLALLAQAEYSDGITLPQQLLEARYHQPNSGLYARITGADGNNLWLSPSAVSLPAAFIEQPPPPLAAGERYFNRRDGLYIYSLQVLWETAGGQATPLQFTVMESADPIDADIAVYRRHLLLWLGGSALLDLHLKDLGNRAHPSHYDYTSVYDLVVFRRLATAEEVDRELQEHADTAPVLGSRFRPETGTAARLPSMRGLPGRTPPPLANPSPPR